MLQITINEKGGQPRQETFDKNEITIGRVQGNDIVLPKGNISKRHSRIVIKDGKFIIVDLKSTNGTYVNGKKINAPQVVKTTDKIYIGDFTLQLNPGGGGSQSAERQASLRAPVAPAREE
ncbi:MAG: FHA domain-containing protein, partial [Myxococcales bacterium]|nr:FHA domain-containing protein [Myxococcales bacterium]